MGSPAEAGKIKLDENQMMNCIDVHPEEWQGNPKELYSERKSKETIHHEVLDRLDHYVQELKRCHIKNIDEV